MYTTFMFAIFNPVLPFAPNLPGGEMLGNIISAAIGIFMIFGFIIAFFHLLFGAFTWITASGDKNALESAQNRITQAIVGLIIMAAVWAVMTLLGTFLGIKFPTFNLPSISDPGAGTSSSGTGSTYTPPRQPPLSGDCCYMSYEDLILSINSACKKFVYEGRCGGTVPSPQINSYNCNWDTLTCEIIHGSGGTYKTAEACNTTCHD